MGARVAVIGATGAVGREMLKVLHDRAFPLDELVPFASSRSEGKKVTFGEQLLDVSVLGRGPLDGFDLILMAASTAVAREWAPRLAGEGSLVVDNSRAFRMEPDVPLVVPEVNPEAAFSHQGIVANPNCSTIAFVVAMAPLHRHAGLRSATVATYQAVSGAGAAGMDELLGQTRAWAAGREIPEGEVFPRQILFNLIPRIDTLSELGYTGEEWKMVRESRKILAHQGLEVGVTCVRVPVLRSHSLAIHASFDRSLSPEEAVEILNEAHGVVVTRPEQEEPYPTPLEAADTDSVYVGRIRSDPSRENGLALWVVMDQLRKGAATNAVQIGELALGMFGVPAR